MGNASLVFSGVLLQLSKETPTLPGVTSVMNHVDDDKRELFAKSSTISFAEAIDPSKKVQILPSSGSTTGLQGGIYDPES